MGWIRFRMASRDPRTMAPSVLQSAPRRLPSAAWLLLPLFGCLALIYLPDAGHGFIKDDVAWIEFGRIRGVPDLERVLTGAQGFYRPLVALSFSADEWLYDLRPFGYGLTNVLLLLATAASIAWLARGLGLAQGGAVMAAAIWALNPHGINMAVLWLSGRTALLLTLWSVLAAAFFVQRRPWLAASCTFLALLSKEEAVALPLILLAWRRLASDRADERLAAAASPRRGVAAVRGPRRLACEPAPNRHWPLVVPLIAYAALRAGSGAHTPGSAPWFYQFTFAPMHVIENALQYLDRSCTFAALVVLVTALATWQVPRLHGSARSLVAPAVIWLAAGFALTLFLPVRSSLYACFPSVGPALLAGALVGDLWQQAAPLRRRRLAIVALVLLAALYPVYRARNVRWVELADLSAHVFVALRAAAADPDLAHITIVDDRTTRRSVVNAFGTLLPVAVRLATGRDIAVWLEPPPGEGDAGFTPPGARRSVRHRLRGGVLERISPLPRNGGEG
jgi:hypothetical protein